MIYNQSAAFSKNTAATHEAVAAGRAGQRIVVLGYVLVNGAASAQSVKFQSGTTTDLSGAMSLPSSVGGSLVAQAGPQNTGLFACKPGEALSIVLSAATAVTGHIAYYYAQG